MTDDLSSFNRFSGGSFGDLTAILPNMAEVDARLVGQRLRALQKYLELDNVNLFADAVKYERSAASNWLNGYNLPRVPQMAVLIDRIPGLTLDWIYLGSPNNMPMGLVIKLTALVEGEVVPVVAPEPAPKEEGRRKASRKKATELGVCRSDRD
jgi:hypothetical protein